MRQRAAAAEGFPDLRFKGRPLIQRKDGRILYEPRHAIGGMGGQVGQMLDHPGRAHDPATARTCHGMGFRHGADHQRAIRHAGQGAGADVFALPDLGVIDFVRDQPEVVIGADLRDPLQRFTAVDHAGGVVGRIDQQRSCAFRHCRDIRRPGLEPRVWARGNGQRLGTRAADRAGVGGIIGVDEKRGITRIAAGDMGCEQPGLTARCDQHVVACGRHAGASCDPRRNPVTQRVGAGHRGISGMPLDRRAVHVLQDRRGGADVMFPDGQLGDFRALGDHAACLGENAPSVGASSQNVADAV